MPMTKIVPQMSAPNTATMTSARKNRGMTWKTSVMRISPSSSHPP